MREADAPLVHAQGFGAEDDLVLVHELLGRRSSPILMGRSLPFLFRCQQSGVRVSQRAASGSDLTEILQKRADRAVWILLACTRRGTLRKSVMCSA